MEYDKVNAFDAIEEATKDMVTRCCKADEVLEFAENLIIASHCAKCGKRESWTPKSIWKVPAPGNEE